MLSSFHVRSMKILYLVFKHHSKGYLLPFQEFLRESFFSSKPFQRTQRVAFITHVPAHLSSLAFNKSGRKDFTRAPLVSRAALNRPGSWVCAILK